MGMATTTIAVASGVGSAAVPTRSAAAVGGRVAATVASPPFAVQRAIVLSPSLVELVDSGTIVATHQLTAEGTFSIPEVAQIVNNPAWLTATSPGVYLLQAALIAGPGTALQIASPAVSALHLALGFGAFLGGEGAKAVIDHVTVTSWNTATGTPEVTPTLGRPFILFQNSSTLSLEGANITDLGSDQAGAEGVTWKNDGLPGGAIGSTFSGGAFGAVGLHSGPIIFDWDAFVSNANDGLRLADDSAGGSINDDLATGNGGSGIVVERSGGSLELAGNWAERNQTGILLQQTLGAPSLKSNRVANNTGFGIALRNANRTHVVQTTSTANGIGLDITKASYGVRVTSLVSRGDRVGLEVHNSFVPELTSIDIVGATHIGIVADSRQLVIDHATISTAPVGIEVRNDTRVRDTSIAKAHRAITIWPNQTVILTNSGIRASHIGVELGAGAFAYLDYSHISAPEATRGGHTSTLASNISRPPVSWVLLIPGAGLLLLCVLMEAVMVFRRRHDPSTIAPKHIWNTT
jgi:hypothetical protein